MFFPAVITIALITFAFGILSWGKFCFCSPSCYCSARYCLSLCTWSCHPTAMVGTGRGAENGILQTCTFGKCHHTDTMVLTRQELSPRKPKSLMSSLTMVMKNLYLARLFVEKYSEHPLSQAIVEKQPLKVSEVENSTL